MKKIVLPTDFSSNSYNAIEYAMQLFEKETCTFYLLHTFIPSAFHVSSIDDGPSIQVVEEVTRQNSETKLLAIEKKMKEKFQNSKHRFETVVSFNLLTEEIKNLIQKYDIDLIIMGTKGATGAQEIFLGTNTMFTIKKSNCAVIAVPESFTFEKPQEVLFATDFKFSMENTYFPLLRSVCATHAARLNILNVYSGVSLTPEQESLKKQLAEYFKNNSYLFHEVEYMNITEAVEQFQIQNKVNFLVMINNKHSFLENFMFKSVVQQLVYHTNVPFMVIPSVKWMKN